MQSLSKLFFVFSVALLRSGSGHIILVTPTPYVWPADGHSNPLSSTGGDWPCKIPAGFTDLQIDGAPTVMAIGEEQTASFAGTAVHGGGSCQFSLLPGFAPSKTNADFRVIKSIEGGCPAVNVTGNLESGSPNNYTFVIPDTVSPGNYTFAWTWNNKDAGQPEYYMNCAPITVTAGSGSPSSKASAESLQEFPPVFMSNIGDAAGGCTTGPALALSQAIAYPDPGSVLEHPNGINYPLFKQGCDGNPLAKSGNGTSGSTLPSSSSSSLTTSTSILSSSAPLPSDSGSSSSSSASLYFSTEPVSSSTMASSSSSSSVTVTMGSGSSSSLSPSSFPSSSTALSLSTLSSYAPTTLRTMTRPPSLNSSTVISIPVIPSSSSLPGNSGNSSVLTVFMTVTVTEGAPSASTSTSQLGGIPALPAGSCTDGQLLCLGEFFATCTGSQWVGPQPLAPGTHCSPVGQAGAGLNILGSAKR